MRFVFPLISVGGSGCQPASASSWLLGLIKCCQRQRGCERELWIEKKKIKIKAPMWSWGASEFVIVWCRLSAPICGIYPICQPKNSPLCFFFWDYPLTTHNLCCSASSSSTSEVSEDTKDTTTAKGTKSTRNFRERASGSSGWRPKYQSTRAAPPPRATPPLRQLQKDAKDRNYLHGVRVETLKWTLSPKVNRILMASPAKGIQFCIYGGVFFFWELSSKKESLQVLR